MQRQAGLRKNEMSGNIPSLHLPRRIQTPFHKNCGKEVSNGVNKVKKRIRKQLSGDRDGERPLSLRLRRGHNGGDVSGKPKRVVCRTQSEARVVRGHGKPGPSPPRHAARGPRSGPGCRRVSPHAHTCRPTRGRGSNFRLSNRDSFFFSSFKQTVHISSRCSGETLLSHSWQRRGVKVIMGPFFSDVPCPQITSFS